ncbi:MAG: RNA polymerase sigma factor [Planctomycetota bacterium]|jgi:RNA polymerase sigma-70 factor (ECF subfamily)
MSSVLKMEFDLLWNQTAGKVRAYMFCACGSWTDADDMVQNCYLRALRGWEKFDKRGSRQAWLFGIAKRTCADWFRVQKRKSAAVGLANLDEFESVSHEQSDVERTEAVWAAVKELGAEQGDVVHLRFAAGLSYSEIAGALDIPVGTVRSRLHRGLKAIREKVKGYEDET